MVGDVGPDGVAAGHDAGAGGGADGCRGVEVIEHDGVFGHLVEVGRLDEGMSGVAAIAVAVVVGHDENDVRWGFDREERKAGEEENGEAKHGKEVMKLLEGVEVRNLVREVFAIRYAWANNSKSNSVNREDLPVSPFRSDDWADNGWEFSG